MPLLLLLLLLSLVQRRCCVAGPSPPAQILDWPSDPCLSQPCKNNGTCSPDGPRRGPLRFLQHAYSCVCPPGVTGTDCQAQKVTANYN
uniref:Uncharacterized protein n=1 Tax=Sphaerodactylus townsendi TaxID=933632 RepID=A0ACB8FAV0_9SAUR